VRGPRLPKRSKSEAIHALPIEGTKQITFYGFVSREIDETATAEEAVEKYEQQKKRLAEQQEKYQRQLAEMSLHKLKGTGLLFDMYHPLAVMRRYDMRVRSAQLNAKQFVQDMKNNCYFGLSLRAPSSGLSTRSGASCAASEHLQAPHFTFDPDVDAILLSDIPAAVSLWDIYDELQSCTGFAAISMLRPPSGKVAREVRARFCSARYARAAQKALTGKELKSKYTMKPSLLSPSPNLEALVMPSEMSEEGRIVKDEILSARVVHQLDELSGIGQEVTGVLLGQEGTPEAKLDLQILYLRRVHHFCFYGATWCDDEWDLRDRCGATLLREGLERVSATPPEKVEEVWAASHERRLDNFLSTPRPARPAALTESAEPVQSRSVMLCKEKTLQVTEEKFQCRMCGKYFRGPEYVSKHLRKVHVEVFEPLIQDAYVELSHAAFLADPLRPLVPQD